PGIHADHREVSDAVLRGAAGAPATVVASLLGEHRRGLLDDGTTVVPEFPFPEEAALALARVTGYATWRAMPVGVARELDDDTAEDARLLRAGGAAEDARLLAAGWLDAHPDGVRLGPLDADRLLRAAGLGVVDHRVVEGADAA